MRENRHRGRCKLRECIPTTHGGGTLAIASAGAGQHGVASVGGSVIFAPSAAASAVAVAAAAAAAAPARAAPRVTPVAAASAEPSSASDTLPNLLRAVAEQREAAAKRLADARAAKARANTECKAEIARCDEPDGLEPLLQLWTARHHRYDAELRAAEAAASVLEEQARLAGSVARLAEEGARRAEREAELSKVASRSTLRYQEQNAATRAAEEAEEAARRDLERELEEGEAELRICVGA